jgi:glycosyltransferase involved in cell wall biosynthesis
MKICLITNLYKPYRVGGAEIFVEKLVNYLSKEHQVFIITSQPFKNLNSLKITIDYENKIKIYRFYPLNIYWLFTGIKKRIFFFFKIFWHFLDLWNLHSFLIVKKILQQERPDVVFTHNLTGISIGGIFSAVKILKIPLVHKLTDYILLCPYSTMTCLVDKNCKIPKFLCNIYRSFKKKFINKKPDIVIGASKYILEIHDRYGFFKESKKNFLPNGIELKENVFKKENKEKIFLYVGQLVKHKGIEILIKAISEIKNKNFKLFIIGEGDPSYKDYLKNLAKEDKRIYFCGKLTPEELFKYYQKANLLIIPSIWPEPFGNVVLEAFSYGVPVVGSNTGGISELIKPNYNGFLFEPNDISALRNILLTLLEDKEKLKTLSFNAFKSAKAYEISKYVENLIKLFEGLKNKR